LVSHPACSRGLWGCCIPGLAPLWGWGSHRASACWEHRRWASAPMGAAWCCEAAPLHSYLLLEWSAPLSPRWPPAVPGGSRDGASAQPRGRETEAGAGYSLPRRLERCRTPSQALGSAESLSHLTIASRCRAGHPMSGREGVRVARAKEMGETWPDSHSPPPAAPPPRSSLTPRQASAGATIPVRPHPVPVHTMLPLLLLCGALGCGADQAGKARRRWRWGWRGLGLARGGHARLMGR